MAHPFEEAGLGLAPFKFVGVEEKRGPISWYDPKSGTTLTAGSPGQPMGTCEYCYQGIAICCSVESADGKRFVVGSDCIRKVFIKGSPVEYAVRRALNAAKLTKDTAKWRAVADRIASDLDLRSALANLPSPNAYRASKGDSRLDWCEWMLANAGTAGRLDVARFVSKTFPETVQV